MKPEREAGEREFSTMNGKMQTDLNGGPGLAVVAGDVLALRGTGLAAAETWALLCQAAQALQDLFLSKLIHKIFPLVAWTSFASSTLGILGLHLMAESSIRHKSNTCVLHNLNGACPTCNGATATTATATTTRYDTKWKAERNIMEAWETLDSLLMRQRRRSPVTIVTVSVLINKSNIFIRETKQSELVFRFVGTDDAFVASHPYVRCINPDLKVVSDVEMLFDVPLILQQVPHAHLHLTTNKLSFPSCRNARSVFVYLAFYGALEGRKRVIAAFGHFNSWRLARMTVTSTNFQLTKSFFFVPNTHNSGAEFPHRQMIVEKSIITLGRKVKHKIGKKENMFDVLYEKYLYVLGFYYLERQIKGESRAFIRNRFQQIIEACKAAQWYENEFNRTKSPHCKFNSSVNKSRIEFEKT
ncbi:hypothetical protein WN51_12742 [Melipona quadrifasciata]|uniref:Uncharacterized protein n=1 Tax=Melipona quadrifasciata TaxID=166423 RepID=A0A0M9A153_9HYME|nr:hypothetical protein WN51_12742 [Melipona quadrifasciata]